MSNMVGSWDKDGLEVPFQLMAYSEAYLDSAERLCKVLKRSTRKATYERGAVVIYLTFHSVELFLKAAILNKSPNEALNHNIEHYENRYRKLYPGNKYNIDVPFKTNYTGLSSDEIKERKKKSSSADQVYRYPIDKDGNCWGGILAFEATMFLNDIQSIKKQISGAKSAIFQG